MSLPQGTAQQEQLEHRSRRTVSGMFFIKCECLPLRQLLFFFDISHQFIRNFVSRYLSGGELLHAS